MNEKFINVWNGWQSYLYRLTIPRWKGKSGRLLFFTHLSAFPYLKPIQISINTNIFRTFITH